MNLGMAGFQGQLYFKINFTFLCKLDTKRTFIIFRFMGQCSSQRFYSPLFLANTSTRLDPETYFFMEPFLPEAPTSFLDSWSM